MKDNKLSKRLSLIVIAITVLLGTSLSLYRLNNNYNVSIQHIDTLVANHLMSTERLATDIILMKDVPYAVSLVKGSTDNPYIVHSELFTGDGNKIAESSAPAPTYAWRLLGLENKVIEHVIVIPHIDGNAVARHTVEVDYEAGLAEFYQESKFDILIDILLIAVLSAIFYRLSLYYFTQQISLQTTEVDSLTPG